MTATEGLLSAQNGQTTGAAATGPNYAALSNGGFKFNVSEIVLHFGREYYTMLSCEPERLHCFYSKQSSALHCNEEETDATVCMGLEEIHERMAGLGYNGVRVVIANIDCQPSMNGGILIFVLGTMTWPTGISRKFAQTFLLAEQPNGYFVLNDIMRILVAEDRSSAHLKTTISKPFVDATPKSASIPTLETLVKPHEANAAPNAIAPMPAALESSVLKASKQSVGEKRDEATKPAEAATPTSAGSTTTTKHSSAGKKSVNIVVKKQDDTKHTSKAAEASEDNSTATAEESKTPSSWAKLAAVQQNRWGNGVVVESKGPVASIPVASPAESKKPSFGTSQRSNDSRRDGRENSTNNAHQNDRLNRDRRVLGENEVAKSIYVHEIKGRIDRQAFRKLFEKFGSIKSYDVVASKGIAFIEFETLEAQSTALSTPLTWNNEPLVVEARRAPQAKREGTARPGDYGPRRAPHHRGENNGGNHSQE